MKYVTALIIIAASAVILSQPALARGHGSAGTGYKASSRSSTYKLPTYSQSSYGHAPKVYTPPGVQNYSASPVRPYIKRDGTYVAPSYRSTPNRIVNDNWSTKGNVNPYTGKVGTRAPSEPGGY